jgi:hypothetical protein
MRVICTVTNVEFRSLDVISDHLHLKTFYYVFSFKNLTKGKFLLCTIGHTELYTYDTTNYLHIQMCKSTLFVGNVTSCDWFRHLSLRVIM